MRDEPDTSDGQSTLDVERLARALRAEGFERLGNRLDLLDFNCQSADCAARAIAAAYAAEPVSE